MKSTQPLPPSTRLRPHSYDDGLEPGARDVRDRLLRHGASDELVARVVRGVVECGARGAYAIDAAARVLGRNFPILPSPKRRPAGPHVFAFVGPTGAGKTTSLAKLGRKLCEAGRHVVFASLDSVGATALHRVGGVDVDIDRTEIPLITIRRASDLLRALRARQRPDVVLLDTPGFSPRHEVELDGLAREVDRIGSETPLDVFLVLPATRSQSSLALSARAFARTAPTGCVLTKLDETDQPAGVLEEVARLGIAVAFLCDGQDVRRHIVRPNPDHFADLLLRGRLAPERV